MCLTPWRALPAGAPAGSMPPPTDKDRPSGVAGADAAGGCEVVVVMAASIMLCGGLPGCRAGTCVLAGERWLNKQPVRCAPLHLTSALFHAVTAPLPFPLPYSSLQAPLTLTPLLPPRSGCSRHPSRSHHSRHRPKACSGRQEA